MDVKRAYFYAAAKRAIFIELPSEDRMDGDEEMVGRLNLSLYGTRDAAQNWTQEYTRTLIKAGFTVGKASPCHFWHENKQLALTVHGDDFTISGSEDNLNLLTEEMKKKWDIKSAILGPDHHHASEIKVLGRRLRWTAAGIEYEADPRHKQVIIDELGLGDCKAVTTPFGPQEQGRSEEQ